MHKTAWCLLALVGTGCLSTSHASAIASVTAFAPSTWIQRGDNRAALSVKTDFQIGDHIITGDRGRVELLVWTGARLRLFENSEMGILPAPKRENADRDDQPEVYFYSGKICINYSPGLNPPGSFELNLADMVAVTIQLQGHICLLREDGLSSIKLLDGSVQLTHVKDPSLIILSEKGSELRIEDIGIYDLVFSSLDDTPTEDNPEPFISASEQQMAGEPGKPSKAEAGAAQADPPASGTQSDYIYTVYLFSTRSEKVAGEVDARFRKAGYDTQVVVTEKDSLTRYRVAVSGFPSLQSAKDFSSSVVGKHGISGTWIGRDQPDPRE